MRRRFWLRTYLVTLLLFLVCLYAGLFSLAFFTYGRSVENTENACLAEERYLARSFERDLFDMEEAENGTSPKLLMQSYAQNYEKQRVSLAFFEEDREVFSSFAATPALPENGTISQIKEDGERWILISGEIGEGRYRLLYGRYAGDLDAEFTSLMLTYAAVASGVSLFLAVFLLFLLKRLSLPLEKLRVTTERIAAGDMTVAAEEKGKDEFAALGKSFNQMVEKVRAQMEELADDAERKQALVDNMAHEMRTPLTSIRGFAEYIEKAAVPEEERRDAALRIVSETDRLKRISEKLLDTAFLRENKIEKETVDLAALLGDTVRRLSPLAGEHKTALRVLPGAGSAQGDPTLLSMLLYNLTENAIKACRPGGEVVLFADENRVSVSDNGKGMTKEQLAHVTEPFYRTDKSRSRAEGGAGLGLALCRQIVLSHGAELTFDSQPERGTTVTVVFPEQEGQP
ncbi:MAG: HAMP domain-containing histidine kinase [Clostridia bacterium]|nr:HAMP domain-containing histidine kinase [Clostridia bacterium]